MNNNDFYNNLDKIRKLYLKQNYEEAVKIADKMDFKRLKDWKYIAMLINLYEAVGKLEDVRYFCILAYNRNLGGKKLLYKLTKVTIRLEEIDEAEELYDEYIQMSGRDSKKYELLYELKAVQGAKKAELIKILEDYMKRDLDEKYAYTLAELYAKTKQNEKCLNFCTRIIERFEAGDVVDKAEALKASILKPVNPADTRAPQAKAAMNNTMPLSQGMPQGGTVGSDTIGINVEQIMSETGNQGYVPNGNFNTTQNIMMQDIFATQDIPAQQDMYTTQDIPVQQDMYATQDIPMQQDMYATQDIPMQQDMYTTQDIPVQQDMYATQDIPMQQDLGATQVIPPQQNLEATKVVSVQQDLGATQVIPNITGQPAEQQKNISAQAEQPQEAEEKEAGITQAQQEQTAKAPTVEETANEVPAGEPETVTESTVRIDTDSINAAMQEAAATMDRSVLQTDGTQDMESTMAMVEAALADETAAAQFDARMDLPEYSEDIAAPVKDKIVLRPFQPEIDKIYEIPMEVKRYFTKYNYVAGLEAQIGEYFESTKHEDKMGTSGIGNIIISGNRSSDKTTLAINVVKALNILYPDHTRKIARISGDSVNQRGIERSIGKLLGAALIIEEAGVIDRQRILELVEVLESDTRELLVILEDSESEINELLKNNPELLEKFNHRMTYKQFTVNELVEMCKRYADKSGYVIDEKALLQLYLRIDEIHSSEDGVSLEDVRDVIDVAVESAKKRASKKIFGGAKKKRVGDKEYTLLIESDFKE
ncbi:MAG: hypothetical protein NC086_05385 [Alistipes sp.]|nr:hypothetical protein [Alistipes sp.]